MTPQDIINFDFEFECVTNLSEVRARKLKIEIEGLGGSKPEISTNEDGYCVVRCTVRNHLNRPYICGYLHGYDDAAEHWTRRIGPREE